MKKQNGAKGLKVNVGKTKVMTGGEGLGTIEEFGTYPCRVCGKGVEVNSAASGCTDDAAE